MTATKFKVHAQLLETVLNVKLWLLSFSICPAKSTMAVINDVDGCSSTLSLPHTHTRNGSNRTINTPERFEVRKRNRSRDVNKTLVYQEADRFSPVIQKSSHVPGCFWVSSLHTGPHHGYQLLNALLLLAKE